MVKKWFLLWILLLPFAFSFGQITVTFILENAPASADSNGIFAAGSFNGWNPADEKARFQKNKQGVYQLQLSLPAGVYLYKITRGDWGRVETDTKGGDVENRLIKVGSDFTEKINVSGWKDQFGNIVKKSTAGKNVRILDTAFYIPQLQRTRRVWIYLPDGYRSSGKRYPVLYMHDGQNVFEDTTSYAGEWGVDEAMDTLGKLAAGCIVVAVDHGNRYRMTEYCPCNFRIRTGETDSMSGQGEGDAYVDFLVKNLKPYIDKNYRTKKQAANTFIAGSSMGGLISMYAILKYPDVFGGAGVFSPSFWIAPPIFDYMKSRKETIKGKVFLYAGTAEGEEMSVDAQKAYTYLEKNTKAKIKLVIRDGGFHNEARWRKEFPGFYKWIVK